MDDLQYCEYKFRKPFNAEVLNLVINGWPSIPKNYYIRKNNGVCFKPCYKWMTFNTSDNLTSADTTPRF